VWDFGLIFSPSTNKYDLLNDVDGNGMRFTTR